MTWQLELSCQLDHVRKRNRIAKRKSRARQKLTQQFGPDGDTSACSAGDDEQTISALEGHQSSAFRSQSLPIPQSPLSWQDDPLPFGSDILHSPSVCQEGLDSHYDLNHPSPRRVAMTTAAAGHPPSRRGAMLANLSAQTYYPTPSLSETPSPYALPLEAAEYPHTPSMYHQHSTWRCYDELWPEFHSPSLLIDETPHAPSHINGRMPEDTQAGSIQWNKRHLELADPPQHKVPSDPVTRSQGASLLHIAIKNGSKGIAHTLVVGGGADVDARDVTNGDRPLHCAVRGRSASMSRMLLHHGARLDLRNEAGLTPLELAVRLQEEEIVELLVEGGAQVL